MSVSERYRQAWESYWQQTSDAPGDAIWDADPSLSAAPHLDLLAPYADPSLPIVDLGCGNGTQTRYLAAHITPTVAQRSLEPSRPWLLALGAGLAFVLWSILILVYYSVRDRR